MPNEGQFKPGNKGKPKGAVNKVTQTMREMVLGAFDDLGGKDGLVEFAKKSDANRLAVYQIASKLINIEVSADVKQTITITFE